MVDPRVHDDLVDRVQRYLFFAFYPIINGFQQQIFLLDHFLEHLLENSYQNFEELLLVILLLDLRHILLLGWELHIDFGVASVALFYIMQTNYLKGAKSFLALSFMISIWCTKLS